MAKDRTPYYSLQADFLTWSVFSFSNHTPRSSIIITLTTNITIPAMLAEGLGRNVLQAIAGIMAGTVKVGLQVRILLS